MQQGRIFFTKFQDEHAKPVEENTTLLHSIVLMYANVCTIARTTLSHLFIYDLVF